ncbi:MAG: glycogen/starch/alpha-glucan phosphorylase [Spirochaetales bacterium]
MKIDKVKFKEGVVGRLKRHFGKRLEEASSQEIYSVVSDTAMELILDNWLETRRVTVEQGGKQAFYLSAEFLMGRALSNNLVNLVAEGDVREVLAELGVDYNAVEDRESDAGLGNGGLGRLAACFLDSLATLDLPGHGYGIRYRYGMFQQKIENGFQIEKPELWLDERDPWGIRRADQAVIVKFGGHVVIHKDAEGKEHYIRVNSEDIRAVPYDTPIVGYDTKTVNTLRLWESEAVEGFDLQLFNEMQYQRSVERANAAEDISRVLYPNDSGPQGKALRLRQQYFFVSASLQDIVLNFKKKYGDDFSLFPSKVAIQLNDTHPVVAIPELMRLLIDWQKLPWDVAWDIVTRTCGYTNHTILSEALEKWPIGLFQAQLPRITMVVEEINRRFIEELRKKYPNDYGKHRHMAIIGDGVVKMAWLAIHGSHSVNGVAALHTEILKNQELKDWYELYPEKFNNKTNGVTQRRFLLKANPLLSSLLNDKIGSSWAKDLSQIRKFRDFAEDDKVVAKLAEIKRANKVRLSEYLQTTQGITLNPDSLFDVQVKRLHEYKRQVLNILHVMYLYNQLKENPGKAVVPRTFLFGAKAASGYRRAKNIIKLINTVGSVINSDPAAKGKLEVHFLENYRVSLAEKIIPAADVSEQISTAGKEASGTGNMKFMMNGALTVGTLDGANVEIAEEAGEENCFIFGLKADQVTRLTMAQSYNPWSVVDEYPEIKKVMNQLIDGTYNFEAFDLFKELYDSLMSGVEGNAPDQYYVLKDFPDYIEAQKKIATAYLDQKKWHRMALINIASSSKFSSDRTISEYAREIWDIKPLKWK